MKICRWERLAALALLALCCTSCSSNNSATQTGVVKLQSRRQLSRTDLFQVV